MMVACGSSRKTETNDGKGGVYVNGKKLDKETGDRVIEVLNGVAGNGNDVISVTMDDRHIAGGSAHASKRVSADGAKVERAFSLKDFTGIDCRGNVDLKFRQSNSYSVNVTAEADVMEDLDIRVTDGVLCIDTKRKDNSDNNNRKVKLEVCAPRLNSIIASGMLNASIGDVSTDRMKIGISGMGNVEGGLMTVAGEVSVRISGMGSVIMKKIECGDLGMNISGCGSFRSDVKSTTAKMSCSGTGNITSAVEADNMTIKNSGSGTTSLKFKGRKIDISNSGVSNLVADVNSESLYAKNSGVAKMTVKGTSDDVKIDGSGLSNVDSRGLNNF